MLHIVNKPPEHSAAHQMLAVVSPGDTVLLIEDAVQAVLHDAWQGWRMEGVEVLALHDDVVARGLSGYASASDKPLADMPMFVSLTEQHPQILTWY
ncbi:sulfurtransferase complex subunit TusB [Halomonas sp. BC2]|uniref:sulfurtransferase complex subunit TusB n=1 Tax=Halomonas sp. BC2 TaxID=1670449 RepID=UPI0009C00DCB|nr:sulfurtransferase complex subunit TusB [Halomonas sp. BC2]